MRGDAADQEPPKKRFKIGDRVACKTEDGWLEGVVIHQDVRLPEADRSLDEEEIMPYEVKLDAGPSVYAPQDESELIVAAGKQPFTDRLYAPIALHKDLFDVESIDRWFVPGFRAALAKWQKSRNPADVDLEALPGVKLETHGVVSFDCFTQEYCDMLLAESNHYRSSGFPERPPNSMNKYGLVLNDVGMRAVFDAMLENHLLAIGARFFGGDVHRQKTLHGQPLGTDFWGGGTLSRHHTFIVRYRPDEDPFLDMHVDQCDVTFNFGLSDNGSFEGSDLTFCGMLGDADQRKHAYSYRHRKGRCVVHAGKRRHGAQKIQNGERSSLIMWTHSPRFRQSDAYKAKRYTQSSASHDPDLICLSQTHDFDFSYWKKRLAPTGGAVDGLGSTASAAAGTTGGIDSSVGPTAEDWLGAVLESMRAENARKAASRTDPPSSPGVR